MFDDITPELLAKAFVGMQKDNATARAKILRIIGNDVDKANALAQEHGLQSFSDYIHKGHAVDAPKALTTPARIPELDEDAPAGSNPWKPDTVDEKGRPDWSPAARKAQADKTRAMGVEFASRLAAAAGTWLGAPRPGAKDLTPRNATKDTRVHGNLMEQGK
jgi:hypothetical protein